MPRSLQRVEGSTITLLGTAVFGLLLCQLLPVKAPDLLRKRLGPYSGWRVLLGPQLPFHWCCFLAVQGLAPRPAAWALNQALLQAAGGPGVRRYSCAAATWAHAHHRAAAASHEGLPPGLTARHRWNCSSIRLAPTICSTWRGRGRRGLLEPAECVWVEVDEFRA